MRVSSPSQVSVPGAGRSASAFSRAAARLTTAADRGRAAMSEQRASVRQGPATVVRDVQVGFLHGGAFVQGSAWSGTFLLPEGAFLAVGGPYELVLDDGR